MFRRYVSIPLNCKLNLCYAPFQSPYHLTVFGPDQLKHCNFLNSLPFFIPTPYLPQRGFPRGAVVWEKKNLPASAGYVSSIPGSGRVPGPTPTLSPGKSHVQRSLAGCIHGVEKESDTTGGLSRNLPP